jgi:CheY-like chemotaxis protein
VAQGTGTILVVDDEAAVRMLAERVLERYGYTVFSAEDGVGAVEMVKAHPEVRAVLLDLAMPVQSGETTAQILRQLRPDLPLILSSGYSEGEALERFGNDMVRGFLQKPYTAQRLAAKIAEVLAETATGTMQA